MVSSKQGICFGVSLGDIDLTQQFERLVKGKISFKGRENEEVEEWRCKVFYQKDVYKKKSGRTSLTLSDQPSTKKSLFGT